MPSIESNKFWNSYSWDQDGDEWSDQAEHCGQPYGSWKASLIDCFVVPYGAGKVILEIGAGHGRWSEPLAILAERLILVDMNPSCLSYCAQRLAQFDNVVGFQNDGKTLSMVSDESVDFVWSYDCLVHAEMECIESYLKETGRVLRGGGRAVLHHSHVYPPEVPAPSGRGAVTKEQVAETAVKNGLDVIDQTQSWGDSNEFNCKLWGDVISVLSKR